MLEGREFKAKERRVQNNWRKYWDNGHRIKGDYLEYSGFRCWRALPISSEVGVSKKYYNNIISNNNNLFSSLADLNRYRLQDGR